jgi:peptide/nickel transport system substrate-binding protein
VPYNPVVHAFNFAYEDPVWREIAGDLRFRTALNLAINRDEIIDAVYYGFASPPVWVPAEFNPEEANRLLDEVGLDQRDNDGWRLAPDGERFEINLEVSAHLPDTVPANELIAEHYKAVGIFTTLKVVEIGLLFQHRNANQLQIDTVWNEATTMHAFGHARSHLIHHIPPWNQWYNSGGTAGEEPPDWFQELYELGIGIGPGIPWDQEIVDRYQQTFYDTIPHINVTYNPGTVLIVNDRLDNVFTEGVAQWVIYSSEQLFFGS